MQQIARFPVGFWPVFTPRKSFPLLIQLLRVALIVLHVRDMFALHCGHVIHCALRKAWAADRLAPNMRRASVAIV